VFDKELLVKADKTSSYKGRGGLGALEGRRPIIVIGPKDAEGLFRSEKHEQLLLVAYPRQKRI
jgi:hypothetical protein